ncbi:MAG: glycoside hydrolase family 97 N-terminal domain-containing protein, partial [Calditrichia bacterium]
MIRWFPVVFILIYGSMSISAAEVFRVSSPDGNIRVEIEIQQFSDPLPQGDYPAYRVLFKGQEVVQFSPLRLLLKNAAEIGPGLTITDTVYESIDQTIEPVFGQNRILRDNCRELTLKLKEAEPPQREFALIFRVYNDAAAFRWEIPRQTGFSRIVIQQEESYIRLNPATAYALPRKQFQTPYEGNYQIGPLREIAVNAPLLAMPLLLQIQQGPWLAVTEADLWDYPGMYLTAFQKEENTLISRLSPFPEDSTVAARLNL